MAREVEGWEETARTIAGVARANLQRLKNEGDFLAKRTKILAAFKRRRKNQHTELSLFDKRNPDQLTLDVQAVFVWLEDLGPAFSMPLEGVMLRTYTKVEDFILTILDRANAATVVSTLERSLESLQKFTKNFTLEKPTDFMSRDVRLTIHEMLFRPNFWEILAGGTAHSHVQIIRSHLEGWKQSWVSHVNLDAWASSPTCLRTAGGGCQTLANAGSGFHLQLVR